MKKEIQHEAKTLWEQEAKPIPLREYVKQTADTEKLLLFSETGAGKTRFYLKLLEYLEKEKMIPKDKIKMCIIMPDRPTGLTKLYGMIPRKYIDCIEVFPVNQYEDTVVATATADRILRDHFKQTGFHGYLVFELMENYWTFSQDYFCRQAYGQTMGDFFAQMQSIMGKNKADKKTAYEAFSGPFGGPWPIIKFFHNFNWVDKIKRFPYNTIFTSELKEEDNKDSIFTQLGYRPAGEKHNQHRMDTILYLSHKGDKFFMKPYKLTGYEKLYAQFDITHKNGYQKHLEALKELEKRGFRVSPMQDLEKEAGITPPKIGKKEDTMKEKIEKTDEVAPDMVLDIEEKKSKIEEKTQKPKTVSKEELVKSSKKEDKEEDSWDI